MATTQTYREEAARNPYIPTLRLLYSGETGIVDRHPHVLSREPLLIGREIAHRDGILLDADRLASRRHARIQVIRDPESGAESVQLTDLGSKNGTFVNQQRCDVSRLRDGDILRISASFFIIRNEPHSLDDAQAPRLLGRSLAMRSLRKELHCVAKTEDNVLLLGESGTGKELAAQTLHELRVARGRRGPFIAINCAAIPADLAESQFFGHKQGAFSGANTASEGFFRAADGGTLFLDEVGELPLGLQSKLLRVLEERMVLPIGSTRPVPCDVRVVAATNRDLGRAVHEGSFRADLLARLDVHTVRLPPLCERREDILPLLQHFWAGPMPKLSVRLVEEILLHHWPLNVRELRQRVRSMAAHAQDRETLDRPLLGDRLHLEPRGARAADLRTPVLKEEPLPGAQHVTLPLPPQADGPPLAREELIRLLAEHDGKVLRVARAVNRSARQVGRWMKEYAIAPTRRKKG